MNDPTPPPTNEGDTALVLDIILNNPRGIYQPGDMLSGHVVLETGEDIPLCGTYTLIVAYDILGSRFTKKYAIIPKRVNIISGEIVSAFRFRTNSRSITK